MATEAASQRRRDVLSLDARETPAGAPCVGLHCTAGRAGGRRPCRGGIAGTSHPILASSPGQLHRGVHIGMGPSSGHNRAERPSTHADRRVRDGRIVRLDGGRSIDHIHSDSGEIARTGLPLAGRGGARYSARASQDRARRARAHAYGLRDLAGASHPGRDHIALRSPSQLARHIDNPLSLPAAAPVWALDRCDRKRLLFVGRFDKRKGGDLVLRAFDALAKADPSLQLTFVGPDGGVAEAHGRRLGFDDARAILCDGSAGSRIDYRGGLDPQQIYPLRANAYLTIVASRWENQSYTALEAMAQGCPLVSSDAGGQSEFVVDGSTGLLAKAGSDDELRERIATLLLDPHLAAELGRRAREHALTQHSSGGRCREDAGGV